MTTQSLAQQGMTFARFFPSDWRTGCLTLNLEEEGLYIRICMYMYDTASALPDDHLKCAVLLRVQPLKMKKVLDSLVAKGKIIRAQGYLINERVIEEFERWRSEKAARELAAKKREDARKQATLFQIQEAKEAAARAATTPHTHGHTPQTTPHHTPPVRQGVTGVHTHSVQDKKCNEINAGDARLWQASGTNQKLEARNQKLEEEYIGGSTLPTVAPEIVFEGERLLLTADEVQIWKESFPFLDFPHELRLVERQVARSATYGATREQLLELLEKALSHQNHTNKLLSQRVNAAADAKASLGDDQSCFINEAGALVVANGVKADFLKLVGGDENVLRQHLDIAGAYVPALAKGRVLIAAARGQIAKQIKWTAERKSKEAAEAAKKRKTASRWATT